MIDFEQIYYTYFADVFRYIRRLSNDEHIAEGQNIITVRQSVVEQEDSILLMHMA